MINGGIISNASMEVVVGKRRNEFKHFRRRGVASVERGFEFE
jgi:hypothetical protein